MAAFSERGPEQKRGRDADGLAGAELPPPRRTPEGKKLTEKTNRGGLQRVPHRSPSRRVPRVRARLAVGQRGVNTRFAVKAGRTEGEASIRQRQFPRASSRRRRPDTDVKDRCVEPSASRNAATAAPGRQRAAAFATRRAHRPRLQITERDVAANPACRMVSAPTQFATNGVCGPSPARTGGRRTIVRAGRRRLSGHGAH